MSRLNAAVIGLGVGERHIKGYLSDERCVIKKLCDFDQEKINEVAKNIKNLNLQRP